MAQELRLRDTRQATTNSTSTNDVKVAVADDTKVAEQGTFSKLKSGCIDCCAPCLRSQNPRPDNPTVFQKIRHGFMLPPQGNIASYLQVVIICAQIWIVLYALTHGEALPGGNLYSLLILFIACVIGGYIISFLHLPPLLGPPSECQTVWIQIKTDILLVIIWFKLFAKGYWQTTKLFIGIQRVLTGMLIVGVMLRNIPGIKIVGDSIDPKWSGALRKLALTVILTRAGLGLDPIKLKKLSWAVLRLAFTPCVAEALTVGIVSHYLLGFSWKWSLMLGCILGALSPAVTVPSLVNLQDRRYGVAKGIPTMLLAAGGLDNVMCVTGFSVLFGIIFSEGDLAVTIIKGPIGVIVGIVYGFIMGGLLWYLPAKDCTNHIFYRCMLLFGCGMVAIFGSSAIGLSGAGPLGCLTTATVAAYKWRQRRKPGETDEIAGTMGLAWIIVQHFLFGLIGAAVNISDIQANTAALGIATLAIGLAVRSVVSFTVTLGTGFNLKERIFITLTWLSKATVQAAIGGLALDRVLEDENPLESDVKLGTDVLTISVLAIIICAPTGATLMAVLGPRFLAKAHDDEEEIKVLGRDEKDGKMVKDSEAVVIVHDPIVVVKGEDSVINKSKEAKGEESMINDNRKVLEEAKLPKYEDTIEPKNEISVNTNMKSKEDEIIPHVDMSNVEIRDPVNGQVVNVREAEAVKDNMDINESKDSVDKDYASDKSTSTADIEKESRRPLYVSSIIVDLNDSKDEESQCINTQNV